MKLQYISVFVSAIVMMGATNAAEVYNNDGNKLDIFGKLSGVRYISSDNNKNGDYSFTRIGFKGETQISDELMGFGTWEQEISAQHIVNNNDQSNFNRLSFAGLKFANMGSIDYGRNYGVLYDIGAWTGVMPDFGDSIISADNLMSKPANGVFTYRNANFFGMMDGLNFALQYQGKNDKIQNSNKGYGLKNFIGDGYGVSASYDFSNNISTGAAYASSTRTPNRYILHVNSDSITKDKDKKTEAYLLGVKYDANDLYLAALYSEGHNIIPDKSRNEESNHNLNRFVEKAQDIKLVAQYQFDFGLRPSLSYLQSKIDDKYEEKRHNIKKYIEFGANYNFNKNMLTFIDYRIDLPLKNDDSTNKKSSYVGKNIALGMAYTF